MSRNQNYIVQLLNLSFFWKKNQSFKYEQKSAALASVFGLNTTKTPPYRYIIHTQPHSASLVSVSHSNMNKKGVLMQWESSKVSQSLTRHPNQNSNHCTLGTELSHWGLHGLCKHFCDTQHIHLLFSCQYSLGIFYISFGQVHHVGALGLVLHRAFQAFEVKASH